MADHHSQIGEKATVSKIQAICATKCVSAHIGFKACDMMLLDTLGAFTKTQGWGDGQWPNF